jgi:hypothetical protein
MRPCKNGKHNLEDILHANDEVVRWCHYCGAIVVDREYDNRVYPGAVLPMMFPEILYPQEKK